MSDKLDRFVTLMKGIFELDKSDLDFGIYRIMNIRKAEIEKFLSEGLPERVKETLAPFAKADSSKILGRISEIESQLGDSLATLPDSVPMVKEYNELKAQLAQGVDLGALESDVYSSLYNFFSRYYDEGDFISKRRYKEGVYAIPYEGEEVKLYWANQDQYYIKTSENFKDYTFIVDDFTVHFRIVDATTEQNNNKESDDKKRKFMLFTEDEENFPGIHTFEYDDEHKELIIRFIYDIPADPKTKHEELNYEKISDYIVKENPALMQALLRPLDHPKDKKYTVLKRHLNAYVAKNTFDYFIHKDLKGFLTRELDFYIKSEVMHLDDLDTTDEKRVDSYLAKVRAIKRVGKVIIDFLAQIENFQKKLWLKKKFVIETNWCITLDRIDESFWEEIRTNKTQVQEWIDLYAIDEVTESLTSVGFTNPPSIEFLEQNQNLVVDTKYFDSVFKEKLIASIDNLDEMTDGLMLNADNYHALRLLKQRFADRVNCIYIDPPYNTGPSEIVYKNNYKNSSWLSLMHGRIEEARTMMTDKCPLCVAIDDYAMVNMSEMLDECMAGYERNMIIVNHHPQGTPKDNVSRTHEYAVIFTPEGDPVMGIDAEIDGFETRAFMRSGSADNNYRYGRPNSFYAVLVDMKTREIKGVEEPPALGDPYPKEDTSEGWRRIYPISKDGSERVWRVSYNSDLIHKGDINALILCSESGTLYQKVYSKKQPIISNWTDKRYNAGTYGTNVIKDMLGDSSVFSYPKSLYTVQDYIKASTEPNTTEYILDFFAGSGTTGQAIMDLNNSDDGKRKYILVEMGNYFITATMPRMKKSIYSVSIDSWKEAKPQNRQNGISHIMKYIKLESYEDALSNITLDEQKHSLLSMFGDEYLINYMLDTEAEGNLLDVDAFKAPFDYKLKVTENNETKIRSVDIIETFNYLIGLTVNTTSTTVYFNAEKDDNGEYEGAVRLVKDSYGKYGFKQIVGTTLDGKRVLVIWRTISDDLVESNAALDAYFSKYRINPLDREYDLIYVNGDNNLQNICNEGESWKVQMTELEFKKRMFEEE